MTARRHLPTRAAAGALAAVCTLLLAVAPVRADTASQLKQAKDDLHALEDRIASEQAQINSLHSQAQDLADQIDQVQTKQARTQRRIADVQKQIREATEAVNATQAQLDGRAWVMYEQGVGSNLEFILGSSSLSDLTFRLQVVDRAAQSDRDLIDQLRDQKTKLQARRDKLNALEADLEAQGRDLAEKSDQIQTKLTEANAIQTQLTADQADAQSKVNDLQKKLEAEEAAREAARLAALKAQQQNDGSSGGGSPAGGSGGNWIKGILTVCPVPGAVFSDDFGAPRYAGGFHAHAGNDVFQSIGAPIYAPFGGSVSDASNELGGKALKVYGSSGYVYNAHMSDFAPGIVGASVGAGTLIGYVGDTGDAKGGAPHDHFEWHPYAIPDNPWKSPYGYTVISGAVDPYPYLSAIC
jgi:peptidoglycan hydrolase CwlO-like protein